MNHFLLPSAESGEQGPDLWTPCAAGFKAETRLLPVTTWGGEWAVQLESFVQASLPTHQPLAKGLLGASGS